jgi:hypothetical protein
MNATFFLLMLVVPALQSAETLPGSAFAIPEAGTVLRAGPGHDFVGVLTLDGRTVVRLGELRGTYREVFVPMGFPIYLHGDFVQTHPEDAQARVTASRVNMRLLPATEGNIPLGQLGVESGRLELLGVENGWVRVMAPLDVPLFAPDAELLPTQAPDARSRWLADTTTREIRRVRAADTWRATDPEWQALLGFRERLSAAATVDLSTLDAEALAAHGAQLDRLAGEAPDDAAAEDVYRLQQRLDQHLEVESRVTSRIEQLRRAEGLVAHQLADEARILSLGLSFKRHGEAVTRRGRVAANHGDGDAVVYTLHPTAEAEGEVLKLSAAPEVANLATLVGKEATLTGRRLTLNSVQGPVLVVHRVLLVRR